MPRKIQSQNLQRAITQKIVERELWFLYTTLLHNVTYLCMKFEVTNFNTFEVMPCTRFVTHIRTDGRTDGQIGLLQYIPPNFVCGGINMAIFLIQGQITQTVQVKLDP